MRRKIYSQALRSGVFAASRRMKPTGLEFLGASAGARPHAADLPS
jgi:hypothetical protein